MSTSLLPSQALLLKEYIDDGSPEPRHFELVDGDPVPPASEEGTIRFKILCVSPDPYQRGWVKSVAGPPLYDMLPPLSLGSPLPSFVTAQVLDSKAEGWKEGDVFGAVLPLETVQIINVSKFPLGIFYRLPHLTPDQASLGLGVYGATGVTAWVGINQVLELKETDTLWVSAAAGAVGSVAVMIAKNVVGCTVIGSAGGPEKCAFLKEELGCDHVIDYKEAGDDEDKLFDMLKQVAPEGIDCYFDNVGGTHFNAAFRSLKPFGRIAVCGTIHRYNQTESVREQLELSKMVQLAPKIQGFMHVPHLIGAIPSTWMDDMQTWVKDKKVKVIENHVGSGLADFPGAFALIFSGNTGNVGKIIVDIKD